MNLNLHNRKKQKMIRSIYDTPLIPSSRVLGMDNWKPFFVFDNYILTFNYLKI